jgi:hypothetical protein
MSDQIIRVQCYAGYQGDQRPVRILLHGQMMEIAAVEDSWYSPGYTYFRVLMLTAERYVLRHQVAQDLWTLEAFRSGGR